MLKAFPKTYTNCGVENTLQASPEKIVTMNQGSLEFLLAMGLQDRIVGTRGVPTGLDPIWPKYKEAYKNVPVMTGADGNSYPSEAEVTGANADFIFADWRSAFSEYAWNNDTNRQVDAALSRSLSLSLSLSRILTLTLTLTLTLP